MFQSIGMVTLLSLFLAENKSQAQTSKDPSIMWRIKVTNNSGVEYIDETVIRKREKIAVVNADLGIECSLVFLKKATSIKRTNAKEVLGTTEKISMQCKIGESISSMFKEVECSAFSDRSHTMHRADQRVMFSKVDKSTTFTIDIDASCFVSG
jgi:hypothetical protein